VLLLKNHYTKLSKRWECQSKVHQPNSIYLFTILKHYVGLEYRLKVCVKDVGRCFDFVSGIGKVVEGDLIFCE